jgi:hypothetical protein
VVAKFWSSSMSNAAPAGWAAPATELPEIAAQTRPPSPGSDPSSPKMPQLPQVPGSAIVLPVMVRFRAERPAPSRKWMAASA